MHARLEYLTIPLVLFFATSALAKVQAFVAVDTATPIAGPLPTFEPPPLEPTPAPGPVTCELAILTTPHLVVNGVPVFEKNAPLDVEIRITTHGPLEREPTEASLQAEESGSAQTFTEAFRPWAAGSRSLLWPLPNGAANAGPGTYTMNGKLYGPGREVLSRCASAPFRIARPRFDCEVALFQKGKPAMVDWDGVPVLIRDRKYVAQVSLTENANEFPEQIQLSLFKDAREMLQGRSLRDWPHGTLSMQFASKAGLKLGRYVLRAELLTEGGSSGACELVFKVKRRELVQLKAVVASDVARMVVERAFRAVQRNPQLMRQLADFLEEGSDLENVVRGILQTIRANREVLSGLWEGIPLVDAYLLFPTDVVARHVKDLLWPVICARYGGTRRALGWACSGFGWHHGPLRIRHRAARIAIAVVEGRLTQVDQAIGTGIGVVNDKVAAALNRVDYQRAVKISGKTSAELQRFMTPGHVAVYITEPGNGELIVAYACPAQTAQQLLDCNLRQLERLARE